MTASQPAQSQAAEQADSESLLELIEDLTDRLQAGEVLDAAALASTYPKHAERLLELVPALEVLAEIGWSASTSHPNSLLAADPLSSPHALDGTLGDYRIRREVGRGGMGVVYEAEEISLRRRVALKVLPFAAVLDPRQLKRFQNEAMTAAQLKHPHIVSVYAVGCERGVNFYAMEYIEGQSLAELIARLRSPQDATHEGSVQENAEHATRPASPATMDATSELAVAETLRASGLSVPGSSHDTTHFRSAARLGREIAEALEHAHQIGVVHRDVKPANLLVDRQGRASVTDFGLAQFDTDAGLTMTGDVLGTLRYMSPEQARGARGLVDHRTDIYSLGITLYELLTLRPAFDGSNRQELLRQVSDTEPRPPRQVRPEVPKDLETIVLKAIAKDPHERYQTAQDLADDLGRYLGDLPIEARRPKLLDRLMKWSRRHVRGLLVAFGVLSVMASGLVASIALILREQGRTEAARREMAEVLAKNNGEYETKTAGERALAGNSAHRPGHLSDRRFAGPKDVSPIVERGPPPVGDTPMLVTSWLRAFAANFYPFRTQDGRRGLSRTRAAEVLEDRTLLSTFVVTSTADTVDANDGVTTLREAIQQANAHPNSGGPDRIHFNIPTSDPGYNPATGTFSIRPVDAGFGLWLLDPVILDGWTQPGWSGAPIIELDGSQAGTVFGGIESGLHIETEDSIVRGLVINRFEQQGLVVSDAFGRAVGGRNVIQGCYIGTDVSGTQALGNGAEGIYVVQPAGHHNLVGTNGDGINDDLERNVISGNGAHGVRIDRGVEHTIAGNLIGTDRTGTVTLSNGITGIVVAGGEETLIGTNADGIADDAERNIISGNLAAEIGLGSGSHVVAGNYVGTDATGTVALGVASNGIHISGPNNRIGTNGDGIHDAAERNVISGNLWNVHVQGQTGNVVTGNYIGTDATGSVALGGPTSGPHAGQPTYGVVLGGTHTRIGTNGDGVGDEAERNVISGNGTGLSIRSPDNQVTGNFIGVNAAGAPLGNRGVGVEFLFSGHNNQIGGEGSLGNTIAHNGSSGILLIHINVFNNSLRGNSIHSNGGLGIDLTDGSWQPGVTSNDLGDADAGANNLQNFPVLSSVSGGAETHVTGTLNSVASTSFIVDFYASTQADSSGHGEGERWLGKTIVTTDASGNASFDVTLPAASDSGEHITSIATRLADHDNDPDTALVQTDTSEFSAGAVVTNAPPTADIGGPYSVPEGTAIGFDASASSDPDHPASTLSYAWDFGYDGTTFDVDATGIQPTVSFPDDFATRTIAVRVTDAVGASDIATTTLTVTNVAPSVAISGPLLGTAGQTRLLQFTATDPSPADQAGNFTFQIDWDGNGAVDQIVVGPSVLEVEHAFSAVGSYTVAVTATDKDCSVSSAAMRAISIVHVLVEEGDLVVGGNSGDDRIRFVPGGNSGAIEAILNGVSLGVFTPSGRLVAYGLQGNDDVEVAGSIGLPSWLYGGEGHDRLKGGAGHDVLDGGTGEDLLTGGGGRDLLEGGRGADRIVGNADDDILIAGWLNFADWANAVEKIMTEWTSGCSYQTRIENIAGVGSGSRANDGFFLKLDDTVRDDEEGSQDVLTGSSGDDWFFFWTSEDRATDLKDEVFADDLDWILA